MNYLLLFLSALILSNCSVPEKSVHLTPTEFECLPNFKGDHLRGAVQALHKSCEKITKNPKGEYHTPAGKRSMRDYAPFCTCLMNKPHMKESELRSVLKRYLVPHHVHFDGTDQGLFTGYYEPLLRGSLKRHGKYQTPLYKKPGNHYLATQPRKAIVQGGILKGKNLELVYVDSAVDAFFLQIQGSGRVKLDNGQMLRLGYSSGNKQPYTPIGKTLLEKGHLIKGRDKVTMQSIRKWLKDHPGQAESIMSTNDSYVFFRVLKGEEGPIGSHGVPLTHGRSIAVDTTHIKLGTPLWVDLSDSSLGTFKRLMVAQDTGGAIKGGVRGDYFFGFGHEAGEKAGLMQATGRYFVLLPK